MLLLFMEGILLFTEAEIRFRIWFQKHILHVEMEIFKYNIEYFTFNQF